MTENAHFSIHERIQEASPLLIDRQKGSIWNGKAIEWNPKTKTALKITALVLGGLFLFSLALVAFWLFPFTLTAAIVLPVLGSTGIFSFVAGNYFGFMGLKNKKAVERGLADPKFFNLLFSLDGGSKGSRTFLSTISTFLESKPEYNGTYANTIKEMKQAAKNEEEKAFSFFTNLDAEAQRISEALVNDPLEAQLICFSSTLRNDSFSESNHAIGIRFSIDPIDPTSVIYSIFNSGAGLNYHAKRKRSEESKGPKLDVQASWKIPLKNLTPDLIKTLLDPSTTLEDRYEKATEITGGKEIAYWEKIVGGYEIRFQTPQKTGNCSMEWIFAYLKYQMTPQDYYKMRKELFEEAIREGLKHPETRKIIEANWVSIQKTVERKRAKAAISEKLEFPLLLQCNPEAFERAKQEVIAEKQEGESPFSFKNYEDVAKVFQKLGIVLDSQLSFTYQEQMLEKVEKALQEGIHRPELKEFDLSF